MVFFLINTNSIWKKSYLSTAAFFYDGYLPVYRKAAVWYDWKKRNGRRGSSTDVTDLNSRVPLPWEGVGLFWCRFAIAGDQSKIECDCCFGNYDPINGTYLCFVTSGARKLGTLFKIALVALNIGTFWQRLQSADKKMVSAVFFLLHSVTYHIRNRTWKQ